MTIAIGQIVWVYRDTAVRPHGAEHMTAEERERTKFKAHEVVGETRVSWLVKEVGRSWGDPDKVDKKTLSVRGARYAVFTSAVQINRFVWLQVNRGELEKKVSRQRDDIAFWIAIAELLGEPTP